MSFPLESHKRQKLDFLLNGRLRLYQPPMGHRVGTDAILLAASVAPTLEGLAIDIGAGVGAVGLALVLANSALQAILLEINPRACHYAHMNATENDVAERVRIIEVDALNFRARAAAGLENDLADLIVMNPPFYPVHAVRPSPDPERVRAHVCAGTVGNWMKEAVSLLRPNGELRLIQTPSALKEILISAQGRLGGMRILPVHSRAEAPASRLLISGVKGSRAPLTLLPPLVLHESDGRFTIKAEAIHRGVALTALATS